MLGALHRFSLILTPPCQEDEKSEAQRGPVCTAHKWQSWNPSHVSAQWHGINPSGKLLMQSPVRQVSSRERNFQDVVGGWAEASSFSVLGNSITSLHSWGSAQGGIRKEVLHLFRQEHIKGLLIFAQLSFLLSSQCIYYLCS